MYSSSDEEDPPPRAEGDRSRLTVEERTQKQLVSTCILVMFLFYAVSTIVIFQTFDCDSYEGAPYLKADLRLRCRGATSVGRNDGYS